jgi:hypothetical protein
LTTRGTMQRTASVSSAVTCFLGPAGDAWRPRMKSFAARTFMGNKVKTPTDATNLPVAPGNANFATHPGYAGHKLLAGGKGICTWRWRSGRGHWHDLAIVLTVRLVHQRTGKSQGHHRGSDNPSINSFHRRPGSPSQSSETTQACHGHEPRAGFGQKNASLLARQLRIGGGGGTEAAFGCAASEAETRRTGGMAARWIKFRLALECIQIYFPGFINIFCI